MEIVALTEDDWAVFRDVRLRGLAEAPYAFGSTLAGEQANTEADWRSRVRARRLLVIAREGDAVIGTVGAYGQPPVIDLITMWVAPEARGRGVGAALVDRIIAHAREIGCEAINVAVSEDNHRAERLYARAGFVRTGERERINPDEERMEIRMRLPLSPA